MKHKVNRKTASRWDQNSERALLEIWRKKMGQLRRCRKNSHILQKMVDELHAQGYNYTVIELKTKMHNMTARYRREKLKSGVSPPDWDLFKEVQVLLAPSKSYHCEDPLLDDTNESYHSAGVVVDNISNINNSSFSTQQLLLTSISQPPSSPPSMPVTSPLPSPTMVETSQLSSSPMPVNASPSSSFMPTDMPSTSTAVKKRKDDLDIFFQNVEKNMQKIHDDITRTSRIVIAIEERKKDLLKAYVEREAEVQKALIEFLKRT